MEKPARQSKKNFHLAGIVPVAALPLDFKMPWHDALIPIAPDYLAVERAIYECAMAGCETIWVVCHRETTPLIRHRLGDFIYDPVTNFAVLRHFRARAEQHLKRVPIYYLPIHPKDRGVRDGLTWSIIYGYKKSYHISRMFSRWATPSKYYVSFPHGIYSPFSLKQLRPFISSKTSVFLKTPEGKSAKDGALVGFSFDNWEYSTYRQSFLAAETRMWKHARWINGGLVGEKLPPEERFNGDKIPVSTFLEKADITEENSFQLNWHYDISSWDNYCKYLSSPERERIKRPRFGFKYHEYHPLAHDDPDLDSEDEA